MVTLKKLKESLDKLTEEQLRQKAQFLTKDKELYGDVLGVKKLRTNLYNDYGKELKTDKDPKSDDFFIVFWKGEIVIEVE